MPSGLTRRAATGLLSSSAAWAQGVAREPAARKPNVMLLCGGAGADVERALTSLAQELESKHGMRCNLLVASGANDLPVVDILEDAHVAVMYLSGLALPRDQMSTFRAYVSANKPIVALRPTLQAFQNWPEFGEQILGARFQYDYGPESTTEVSVIPGAASHPILKGLPKEFQSRSPLYHVLPLGSATTPLLMGKSAGQSDRAEQAPNPVAWTRTAKGARVFYTSLGNPADFDLPAFRLLLVNGIHWALGR